MKQTSVCSIRVYALPENLSGWEDWRWVEVREHLGILVGLCSVSLEALTHDTCLKVTVAQWSGAQAHLQQVTGHSSSLDAMQAVQHLN